MTTTNKWFSEQMITYLQVYTCWKLAKSQKISPVHVPGRSKSTSPPLAPSRSSGRRFERNGLPMPLGDVPSQKVWKLSNLCTNLHWK